MSTKPGEDLTQGAGRSFGRRRFVTLRGEYGHEEVDMEIPGDVAVSALLPDLIKALNWPTADGDKPLHYQLRTEGGKILAENETALDAGVENSDVLWIVVTEERAAAAPAPPSQAVVGPPAEEGPVSGFAPVAAPSPSPRDRRGTLAPPISPRLAIHEPSLASPTGVIFVLGTPPLTIGRSSRGYRPDVDLSDLDPEFISSRQHAQIHYDDGSYVLVPRPTTNGTFVNGAEVPADERRPLRDGDVIQFGFEGVKLTFFSGKEPDIPASFFR